MAKLLGIDFGTKRMGLALTDDLQMIGSPWKTISPQEFWLNIATIITREKIEGMVVGLAFHRDGSASETTQLQQKFIQRLRITFPSIPIHEIDERYTSKLANQAIQQLQLGKKKRDDKSLTDKISAAIILQTYLDSRS